MDGLLRHRLETRCYFMVDIFASDGICGSCDFMMDIRVIGRLDISGCILSRSRVDGEFDDNDRKKMRRHCSVNWT